MCSIYGALGHIDWDLMNRIRSNARDRGRDGGSSQAFPFKYTTHQAYLGSWRAAPTPEIQHGPPQPYDGIIHNGTIANDAELGRAPGEIDSQVLPRVLKRYSLQAFRDSLLQIKGSYAVAVVNSERQTIYLGCNYRPIHYWSPNGNTLYFSSMSHHFKGVVPSYQEPRQLEPYSVLDLATLESLPIPREGDGTRSVVVIHSGGLDSTVVAASLVAQGYKIHLLHFLYDCMAQTQEAEAVWKIASALEVDYSLVHVPYRPFQGVCPLFDEKDGIPFDRISGGIAGAEYAHEWVPARNFVFVALATAFAEANGYHAVALGNNLEEAGAFGDNEEQFTHLLDRAAPYAVQNGYRMNILSPVGNLMKHEIVRLGLALKAPLHLTWSCYRNGGDSGKHCGKCGPCFMRREAFRRNGAEDPVFNHEAELLRN